MNTEDLIRESLLRQADRAPAPGAVLAALHRPPRRRRALVLAVAAVVGVLVVAAGVVALRQNLAEPLPPAATPIPVRYSPDHLPDGFSEHGRSYSPDGSFIRMWSTEPLLADHDVEPVPGPTLRMVLQQYRGDRLVLEDEFGGLTGQLSAGPEGGKSTFTWRPDPADGVVVSVAVDRVPDGRAVLEEVVRSTRPDPTTMPVPLWVDSGTHVVHGTPDDWRVGVSGSRWEDTSYDAVLSSRQPFFNGEPVEVRGVVGIAGDHGLTVRVAPDRWLAVQPPAGTTGTIPVERLVAIANAARVDTRAEFSWLGGR